MTAVELHVNATYYAQNQALESVYGKSQSVIVGKLFYSYREVFELAQALWDSKTSAWNCSYEILAQKEAMTIYQDRVFESFLCVLSVSSVSRGFLQIYCDTGSLGRSMPTRLPSGWGWG